MGIERHSYDPVWGGYPEALTRDWQPVGDLRLSEKDANAAAGWEYTQNHVIDHTGGEWFWGIEENGAIMPGQDKAGFWKCPYHNSRACLEAIKRSSA